MGWTLELAIQACVNDASACWAELRGSDLNLTRGWGEGGKEEEEERRQEEVVVVVQKEDDLTGQR